MSKNEPNRENTGVAAFNINSSSKTGEFNLTITGLVDPKKPPMDHLLFTTMSVKNAYMGLGAYLRAFLKEQGFTGDLELLTLEEMLDRLVDQVGLRTETANAHYESETFK